MRMLSLHRAAIMCAAAVLSQAAEPAAARWAGTVQIPGREFTLVIDLAQDDKGRWIGSAVLPTAGVAGALLSDISISNSAVSFVAKGVLGGVTMKGSLTDEGIFSG